jgi:ferredoxin
VFNTFGMLSGATLRIMRDLATQKGFRVIDGHSLHMPENIATMIVAGMGNEQAPSPKEMGAFDGFISRLAGRLSSPETLSCAKRFNVPLPIRLLPAMPRFIGKREMGSKFVDDALCTHCGLCRTKCPYGAITMAASPVFDEKKCMTCWACFNHCPMRAIYTKKVRGKGHYPSPIAAVQEKLKA